VLGVSAGGELALALGLPTYTAPSCARAPERAIGRPRCCRARFCAYLVAGRQEPFFLENATRWADALHAVGADVVMTERDESHGGAFWRRESR
jgi:hypothetical protein